MQFQIKVEDHAEDDLKSKKDELQVRVHHMEFVLENFEGTFSKYKGMLA
jgi:hypothetical protein